MSTVQSVNSIVLRRNGLDKKGFKRMNAIGVSTSFDTALSIQSQLGANHEDTVISWRDETCKKVRNSYIVHIESFYNFFSYNAYKVFTLIRIG